MADIAGPAAYPIRLEVDYPEQQSRWKALLRLPLSIPVLIFSSLLQSGVALTIWAAILVSGRIPTWLFEFQVAVNRWQLRAGAYFLILTDDYPPFEGDYGIRYDAQYPERLSRWRLVIWKFITSIPHFVILFFLAVSLVPVTLIAWFAILFTGRFPRGLHAYVAGVLRRAARVHAYVLSLTDAFPPYSSAVDAGPASRDSYVTSSIIGTVASAVVVALVVAVFVVLATGAQHVVAEVSYDRLLAGTTEREEGRVEVHSGIVYLRSAVDPADDQYSFLAVRPGYRLVEFRFTIRNWRGADEKVPIRNGRFELRDTRGVAQKPLIATVDGNELAPFDIASGDTVTLQLLFELPLDADPAELKYDVLDYISFPRLGETIVYEFR